MIRRMIGWMMLLEMKSNSLVIPGLIGGFLAESFAFFVVHVYVCCECMYWVSENHFKR
jgi:hypothetical protein